MQRRDFTLVCALTACGFSVKTAAQHGGDGDWPNRRVKWIVSQPSGSGPDILARYVAELLAKNWEQAVVIDNRPGGQNIIGAQAAARSAPDGYTFYYATTAAIITNPLTFKLLPYQPDKDFIPVRLIGRSPFVIAAGRGFEGSTVASVIAKARAIAGTLTIATEGPKTLSGILADALAAMAGIRFTQVPYSRAVEGIQDVMGGRVGLICLPEAALLPFIRSGQLRAIAVSTAEQSSVLPNVPSLAETFAGFEFSGWNALFAPTGTPSDITSKVERDIDRMLKQPEVVARLLSLGSIAEVDPPPGGFDAFLRAERERWSRMAKVVSLTAEWSADP
ncbi:MAG: tripartite tricarboxylate transporter substrate-binding protein [Casimicrobium sp.]